MKIILILISFFLLGCGETSSISAPETNTTLPVEPAPELPIVPEPSPPEPEVPVYDVNANIDQETVHLYMTLINEARSQEQDCGGYGIKPAVDDLNWSIDLFNAAFEHSEDMRQSGVFSHDGSGTEFDITAIALDINYSTHVDRVFYNDWDGSGYLGENIAYGYPTAESVINGWLASDGHCNNIMNPDFTHIGMAESINNTYWTQNIGKGY